MSYHGTILVDLSEDFGEGCNATIRDPRCVLRITDLALPEMEGLTDEQKRDELTRRSHDVLRRLIVAWNVWDVETGDPLPLPRHDPTALDPERCPEFLVIVLWKRVNELMLPFVQKHLAQKGQTPANASSETTESSEAQPSNSVEPRYALSQ